MQFLPSDTKNELPTPALIMVVVLYLLLMIVLKKKFPFLTNCFVQLGLITAHSSVGSMCSYLTFLAH